jgi:hypothetical protein
MPKIGKRVRYVVQRTRPGYGHVIDLQTMEEVSGECPQADAEDDARTRNAAANGAQSYSATGPVHRSYTGIGRGGRSDSTHVHRPGAPHGPTLGRLPVRGLSEPS